MVYVDLDPHHPKGVTREATAHVTPGSMAPTAGRVQRVSQVRTRTRQGVIPVRIATREHIQQHRLQFVRIAERIQTHRPQVTMSRTASAMPGSRAPTAGRVQRASQASTRTRQDPMRAMIAVWIHTLLQQEPPTPLHALPAHRTRRLPLAV